MRLALGMVLEKVAQGDVLGQWLRILREYPFPEGPTYRLRGLYPVEARNRVTNNALGANPDDWGAFLFFDSDMTPDPGLGTRLSELMAHPAFLDPRGGVVCGAYYGRGYPFEIQAFEERPDHVGLRFLHPARWIPALQEARRRYLAGEGGELLPIAGGGTGCMLIRRDVLERMAERRGEEVWHQREIDAATRLEIRDDVRGARWSEDITFCLDVADELGIQVLLDSDLRMTAGHLHEEIVGPDHYLAAHIVPQGAEAVQAPPGFEVQRLGNRAQRRAALRR